MTNHSKLRYVVGLLFLLVLVGIYYLVVYFSGEKPYKVLTPDVYPEGTTVSLYKDVPKSFPKEFILANTTLDYSGELKTPNGKTQTTASFVSNENILYITNSYRASLSNENWSVSVESLTGNAAILKATKNNEVVIVSIVPISPTTTLITIQYEK